MKMKLVSILLSILVFNGCSSKISEGTYQTHFKGNVLWEGDVLQIFENQAFFLEHWSDDLLSNKKGKGHYQLDQESLILNFENLNLGKSTATQSKLSIEEEGIVNYEIFIQDIEKEPLIGVNVLLLDANQKLIQAAVTNLEGRIDLHIQSNSLPNKIDISYIGMEGLSLSLNDINSKKIDVTLVELCKYWQEGEELEYNYKLRRKFLILQDKKQRVKKLKKIK